MLFTMPSSPAPHNGEVSIPPNPDHAETAKDPLRSNISPLVTDVISNAINVIPLLEAFSGMIPAPPFTDTDFTLIKVIIKTVQVSILCPSDVPSFGLLTGPTES